MAPRVEVEEVPDEDEEMEMPSPSKKPKTNGAFAPSTPTLQPAAEISMPRKERPEKPIVVEEVDEDADMSAPPLHSDVLHPSQIVEPEQSSTSNSTSTPVPFGANAWKPALGVGAKSSAPKAPSKLRYSIQVDKDEGSGGSTSPNEGVSEVRPGGSEGVVKQGGLGLGLPSSVAKSGTTLSTPPSVVSSVPAPAPVSLAATASTSTAASKPRTTEEIKATVALLPESTLPTYTFDFATSSPGAGPSTVAEIGKANAKAVSESALPSFNFNFTAPKSTSTITTSSMSSSTSSSSSSFNWAAAGMKPPSKPVGEWDCAECTLSNPASNVSGKCQFCDTPKSGVSSSSSSTPTSAPTSAPVTSPAPVVEFNWAAAGMSKPSAPAGGWTCSTCLLSNAESATQCSVCDTER